MINRECRLLAVDSLLESVDKIISPLDEKVHPELEQRVRWFFDKGMVIVAPPEKDNSNGTEISCLETIGEVLPISTDTYQEEPLFMWPLFEGDEQWDKTAAYCVKRVRLGAYGPRSNIIFLKMDFLETPLFLGSVFLHELGHAYAAHLQGRVGVEYTQPHKERIAEEVEMWTIDARMARDLGGQPYRLALDEGVKAVREEFKQPEPGWWTGKGVALHHFFGEPPADELTLAVRDLTFKVFCYFSAFDLLPSSDCARAKKFTFLEQLSAADHRRERMLIEEFGPE